jgi:hypothetical protein
MVVLINCGGTENLRRLFGAPRRSRARALPSLRRTPT